MSPEQLKEKIREEAKALGFVDLRVTAPQTGRYFSLYKKWVNRGYHGEMDYLARNLQLREKPDSLHPGTASVLTLAYPYLPRTSEFCAPLEQPELANISRYALGRDYHKFLRKKLKKLADTIRDKYPIEDLNYRVFVDSAPVLETSLAEKAGLGFKGKHTLLIHPQFGSWVFLGEIFLNLSLPADKPTEKHCGDCTACIKICPTQAIIGENLLDARRCISYLTIENPGPIPIELRPLIGNRIYGCDDCQLICPLNRQTQPNQYDEFAPRHHLHKISIESLLQWSETDFLTRLEGSPIRRIGYQNWLRNLAVAAGNAPPSDRLITLLKDKKAIANDMVREHIDWAINRLNLTRHSGNEKNIKLARAVRKLTPHLA